MNVKSSPVKFGDTLAKTGQRTEEDQQTPIHLRVLKGAASSPLILALVIFGLALGPRLLDLAVFIGPDEFSWVTRSANFSQALASGDLAKTYQTGHPGVTLMWAETVGAWLRYGFQTLSGQANWQAIVGPNRTMALLASKREVVAVANALLLVFIVLLTRRLFGYRVAWLAGFLLVFDPFLLTESRALRTEGLVTGFNTLALLVLLLYVKERRLRYGALTGFLTGLALLSKVSATVLIPLGILVIGFVTLFKAVKGDKARWRMMVLSLFIWGGAIFLTIFLLWPALWVTPVNVIRQMYDYVFVRVAEGGGGGQSFFLGQQYREEPPGVLFFPVVLLYRTGPPLWLGLGLLVVMFWRWRTNLSRWHTTALGIMVAYLGAYLVIITSSELKFDRYTIPMLPTLSIMAAVGVVAGWQWAIERRSGLAQWGWPAALLILSWQMALAVPHHPYYYTYWNPLLGGPKQAVRMLPVGIGGEGIDQVAAYLNTLPNVQKLTLASANSQIIRPLFKGQTIALDNLDGEWIQADYVMIYISQLQRGKHAEDILAYLARHEPIYTLVLQGLEYTWLYPGPAAQFYGGGHKLEGRGTLFGYDLDKINLVAGEQLPVTLYWRNEGQLEDDRFFVRLMDLDGYIWTEAIAQPRPGFEEANRQENAIVESEATLTLPVGMPPGDYFFKPGFRTATGEIIGYFELPGNTKPIQVFTPKTYPTLGAFQPPFPGHLMANDDVEFLGYDLDPETSTPGSPLWLTLYWQAQHEVTHDYVILLRLLDEDEQELAYWLGRPVRSGYPSPEWRSEQLVQDPWRLELPTETVPGLYGLELALFDASTEAEVARTRLGTLTVLPSGSE